MEREGEEIHVSETEAKAGNRGNHVRNILVISLFLAIVIMSVLWITGALNAPQDHVKDGISNQASPTPTPTP
jgi:hypothetical protein